MMPKDLLRATAVCVVVHAAMLLASVPAAAQSGGSTSRAGQGPHVRVELIADRGEPGPGMRFALRFNLDPGWHIYWQNPGDSGGPPQVTWTFPPGMMASGIEWPVPERIDIGGLVNYGYHDSVTLPVPLAVAADARMPPAFAVHAAVRWMACATMCVPGRADLTFRFPLNDVEQSQVAGWKAAIDAARKHVPGPAPASWRASAASSSNAFVLDVLTGARETEAVFFPLEVSQINDSAAQGVTALPNGVRLTLEKSSQLTKDPAALRGVVALPGGRAFTVDAPLR